MPSDNQGKPVSRSRAADDFTTIRARLDELRRERAPNPEAPQGDAAKERESITERRRRERMEGYPPPWVPTIFLRP
jgi:hypothetical protein